MSLTSAPVGRDQLLSRLVPIPVCALIKAPSSTGKRTVVQYLADQAGIPRFDQRLVPSPYWADERGRCTDPSSGKSDNLRYVEPELTVDMVRDLSVWARSAPRTSAGKLAIVRLDHERADGTSWVASPRCATGLLKLLEEPPAGVRFALLASGPVAPTIVSRSVTVSAGLLSTVEVAEILYRVSDLDQASATEIAALGSGRVAPALAASTDVVGAKESVLGLLGDIARSDTEAAASRAREWTQTSTSFLVRAAHERVSGRFVVFTSEELISLPLPKAMVLLTVVKRAQGARPRLLVGALVSALT